VEKRLPAALEGREKRQDAASPRAKKLGFCPGFAFHPINERLNLKTAVDFNAEPRCARDEMRLLRSDQVPRRTK
jgi:hypothetical protein